MASLLMMIGSAVAFSGTNFLFHKLSASDGERKRHDLAVENSEKDHTAWVERCQDEIYAEQKRRRAAKKAEDHMEELDGSMAEYSRAWEARNPEPQLHQYYHPSKQQKKKTI